MAFNYDKYERIMRENQERWDEIVARMMAYQMAAAAAPGFWLKKNPTPEVNPEWGPVMP